MPLYGTDLNKRKNKVAQTATLYYSRFFLLCQLFNKKIFILCIVHIFLSLSLQFTDNLLLYAFLVTFYIDTIYKIC